MKTKFLNFDVLIDAMMNRLFQLAEYVVNNFLVAKVEGKPAAAVTPVATVVSVSPVMPVMPVETVIPVASVTTVAQDGAASPVRFPHESRMVEGELFK